MADNESRRRLLFVKKLGSWTNQQSQHVTPQPEKDLHPEIPEHVRKWQEAGYATKGKEVIGVNHNIFQILAELEDKEPGALRKYDTHGIRIMVRNKIVVKQDGDVILHRVSEDGLFDIYCVHCGEYITSMYEDFIRRYPKKWQERKNEIRIKHESECVPVHPDTKQSSDEAAPIEE